MTSASTYVSTWLENQQLSPQTYLYFTSICTGMADIARSDYRMHSYLFVLVCIIMLAVQAYWLVQLSISHAIITIKNVGM